MKTTRMLRMIILLGMPGVFPSSPARAATTIDAANHDAWGANIGWVEGRGDITNGLVIGEYVCSGYIYSANVGWINCGSGAPANGIAYQNLAANDFGVNMDNLGNLRGYAYGANIGWINFEATGAPAVSLLTGVLSGDAYSANCGWISLSNASAFVQTDVIRQGALAPNGLPVAWLLANFGATNVDANADADGDGMSNLQEYLAGTNPNDPNDTFRIIDCQRNSSSDSVALQWTAKPTRFYVLQQTSSLLADMTDLYDLPVAGWNNYNFTDTNNPSFYRVRAYRPLMP